MEENQKILAQIVGLTIWRLSEETFFQWDPKYFSDIMSKALTTIKSEDLKESKGKTLKLQFKQRQMLKEISSLLF